MQIQKALPETRATPKLFYPISTAMTSTISPISHRHAGSFDKKYGKEAVSLRKSLILSDYTEGSFNAAVRDIETLRDLHRQIDEAVLSAYGWTDVRLNHGFHEVDFLPETDRTRYTITPEARKALLQRLLELNHERHAEELEAALAFDALFQSAKADKLGNQIRFDF